MLTNIGGFLYKFSLAASSGSSEVRERKEWGGDRGRKTTKANLITINFILFASFERKNIKCTAKLLNQQISFPENRNSPISTIYSDKNNLESKQNYTQTKGGQNNLIKTGTIGYLDFSFSFYLKLTYLRVWF